jgi:hypothetical protein
MTRPQWPFGFYTPSLTPTYLLLALAPLLGFTYPFFHLGLPPPLCSGSSLPPTIFCELTHLFLFIQIYASTFTFYCKCAQSPFVWFVHPFHLALVYVVVYALVVGFCELTIFAEVCTSVVSAAFYTHLGPLI